MKASDPELASLAAIGMYFLIKGLRVATGADSYCCTKTVPKLYQKSPSRILANQQRQHGRLVTGAQADLEHAILGFRFQRLRLEGHHVRHFPRIEPLVQICQHEVGAILQPKADLAAQKCCVVINTQEVSGVVLGFIAIVTIW